ncbi:MAG TPA: ABC transporter permease [Gemmatimonadaceae bacterium]|nr:ABC transporter permease [Gemmatimonadaceae bacterium]
MTWREWWSRVRGSLRRDETLEREMEREMAHHLEMATRRNLDRGLTPEAARRQAKLAFGSAEAFKEEAREAHRARTAESLVSDVRFALRSLRRSPAFTIAAVLTLALGIGASAAIFTVVNAVLLRPLPIPQPEDFRYVGWAWAPNNHIPALTDLQYEFVRDHNRVFDAVAAYRTQEVHLGDESAAQPIRGLRVSSGFFGTMGIPPRLGRGFEANELETEAPVVILSDHVWRTRLGADSGILGRQIRLDGEPRTVVGVLPPEFHFPAAPEHTGYLVPLAVRGNPNDEGHNTDVIGRLRHGTPDAMRDADLRSLSAAFRAAHPSVTDTGSFRLFTHVEAYVGSALERTLWLLFGAISLVLLIACANTATLLLVRAAARQREIAVRVSIGAGPRRILQQLLTEGLVLSSIAATLGVLLSIVALRVFLAAAPGALPAGAEAGVDARVLAFAVAISAVTGVAFGLAAGIPAYRARLQSVLLGGAHGGTAGGRRLRDALVFLQTAVAIVLLAGASLLAASFTRLIRVDPGFDADRVVAVGLGRLPPEYDAARRELLVNRLLERVRALPGVEHVAAAPNLPLERGLNFPIDVPERPELAIGAVELRFVSPGYLATLGIPLRGGRHFDDGDVAGAEPVAIVNEAFARHFWQEASPVGRSIRIGHFRDRWRIGPAGRHETRVIGVAADIHEVGLDRPARPTVLVPRAQNAEGTPVLLVRGETTALPGVLRKEIVAEEPRLAPVVQRLSRVVSRSVAAPRFRTMLVGAFAGFALLLAGIGIYGVIASGVQHRRREIALRLALGASGAAVATAVSRRCLAHVAAGALVGLIGFWGMRRVLTSWLFDMTPGDPLVLTGTVAMLALVAGFASWIPTRRATRVDPATSLRLD